MSLENHSILIWTCCGIVEIPVIYRYPISRRPEFKLATREEANLFVLSNFVNLNFVSEISTPQCG